MCQVAVIPNGAGVPEKFGAPHRHLEEWVIVPQRDVPQESSQRVGSRARPCLLASLSPTYSSLLPTFRPCIRHHLHQSTTGWKKTKYFEELSLLFSDTSGT